MITPDDIMAIAKELSNKAGEAAARSAISRAYYAVFHEAKHYAESVDGYVVPTGLSAHYELSQHFLQQPDDDAIDIGRQISKLHQARKHADYAINRPMDAMRSKFQIVMAETLIRQLRDMR